MREKRQISNVVHNALKMENSAISRNKNSKIGCTLKLHQGKICVFEFSAAGRPLGTVLFTEFCFYKNLNFNFLFYSFIQQYRFSKISLLCTNFLVHCVVCLGVYDK